MSYKKKILYLIDGNGCWIWQLFKDAKGYGKTIRSSRQTMAHRYFYELYKGIIPKGMTVDHICRVTSCVNPAHLQLLTVSDNSIQSKTNVERRAQTHCKRGHELTPDNVYLYNGRNCKKCRQMRRNGFRVNKQ